MDDGVLFHGVMTIEYANLIPDAFLGLWCLQPLTRFRAI